MGAIAYARCECCGLTFGFRGHAEGLERPEECYMCRVRGRLCMHNLFERSAGREPGDPPVPYHTSVPHQGMEEFADDPAACPACRTARERAAWLRERRK